MPPVRIEDSFIPGEDGISYYDLVQPLYKLSSDQPPHLIGSCFPVGIGIYLTAAHNFDLFGEVRNRYKRPGGERTEPTTDEMLERKKDMEETRFLKGTNVNLAPLILDQAALRQGQFKSLGFSLPAFVSVALDFDLAVLFVPDDLRRNSEGWRSPIACLGIQEHPKKEQKIVVAGFPGANQKLGPDGETGQSETSIGLAMVLNEGEIVELCPKMRDPYFASYPCMETTVEIAPGHSGGPAICKESLAAVGINSIGGLAGYGVLSWLGKALDVGMMITHGLTVGGREVPAGSAVTLRELAEAELIQIC